MGGGNIRETASSMVWSAATHVLSGCQTSSLGWRITADEAMFFQRERLQTQTPTVRSIASTANDSCVTDQETEPEAGQKEIFASWSLFILIMLLIIALFVSYILQARRIQAVHETVISIFAGKHRIKADIGLEY